MISSNIWIGVKTLWPVQWTLTGGVVGEWTEINTY